MKTTSSIVTLLALAVLIAPPALAEEKESDDGGLYERARALLGDNKDASKPAEKPTEKPAPKPVESEPKKTELPTFSEVAPKPPLPPKKVEPKALPPKPAPRVIVVGGDEKTSPANNNPVAPKTVAPMVVTEEKPKQPVQKTYAIKSGDTFSSIALHLYGAEKHWIAIAKANPLVDPIRLKIGQVIRLPDLNKQEEDRAKEIKSLKESVDSPDAPTPGILVEPGDTLSGISHRIYGKARFWRLIFDANRDQLTEPDDLRVGMKLKIPPKPAESGE